MQLTLGHWLALAAISLATTASQAQSKSYTAGHFELTLDGHPVLAKSIDGGAVKKTEDVAPVVIEIDRMGAEPMWQWLEESMGQTKKNLVLPLANKRRMDWTIGHVTSVKFPKLESSDKSEVTLKLVIVAEAAVAKKAASNAKPINVKQKKFLSNNFKLTIGDLPTKHVNKIDALTIKGGDGDDKIKVDNVKVTIDPADVNPWKVAVKTKSKKNGSIELTEADGGVWKTLDLTGVRVMALKGSVATLAIDSVSLH